jgi:UTP--glucose-1-phosphate uridylyltransferase
MDINQVVIPAAGLGTRFLPYTKSIPKEMLPLLNKPALAYIIEEGLAAQRTNFLIITNQSKQAIAHYFAESTELNSLLHAKNSGGFLGNLPQVIQQCRFTFINQNEPKGLGDAISLARGHIDTDYFCVCLPDDIITPEHAGLSQLITHAQQQQASVIAVQEVPRARVSSYGIIVPKKQVSTHLFELADVVEKPSVEQAPSNLAIVGRYVLSTTIFKALDEIRPCAQRELQLTDAISYLLKHTQEKVFAYKIQGSRYDIGTPIGWLQALLTLALENPEYAPSLREIILKYAQ